MASKSRIVNHPGEKEEYRQDNATETGIQPKDQIELAAGALRNMGLTTNFARTVLICGHGSTTANNPYGSASYNGIPQEDASATEIRPPESSLACS